MPLMNLNFERMGYSDANVSSNPRERVFDISTCWSGVNIENPISYERRISPDEVVQLESTLRNTTYDATTEFEFSQPYEDTALVSMRYTGTGTHPGFRVKREISGDVDTEILVERISNTSIKLSVTGGTALNLATVQIGDDLYIARNEPDAFVNPFGTYAAGNTFTVIDKDSTSIVIRDDSGRMMEQTVLLGADYGKVLRIFSSDGVKKSDRIKFSESANVSTTNKNLVFKIITVTDNEITYYNPNFIPETAVPGLNALEIFDRVINFISIESTGPARIILGSDTIINLSQFADKNSLFVGTVETGKLSIYNPDTTDLVIKAQVCTFTE